MPSRRAVLGSGSALAGLALTGCSAFDRGVEGYVQLKSIQVVENADGRRTQRSILRATLSSPPGAEPPELTHRSDEWADRFDTPREPVVPDTLHDDLNRAYDAVRYVVGVCSPEWAHDDEPVGCYNVATTRENFNEVQVHDRVRASSDGTYLTIHSVDGSWTFEST